VNNSAYLALIRDATDRIAPEPRELATIDIEFKRPVPPNSDIEILTDADPSDRDLLRYRLSLDGEVHAIATARWRRGPAEPDPFPAIDRDAGGETFSWEHEVRSYEIAPDGALRPSAALQWFEYAVYRAAGRVGWSAERMHGADFVTLQAGHRLVLGRHPAVAEPLRIVSRIVEMRRVSGTWQHEARRADGTIVAWDRSRGAFVDLSGKVRRPPAEMIVALLRGERR